MIGHALSPIPQPNKQWFHLLDSLQYVQSTCHLQMSFHLHNTQQDLR